MNNIFCLRIRILHKRIRPTIFWLMLWGALLLAGPAAGEEQPLYVLKGNVADTVDILQDPRYQDITQKEAQQLKLCEIADKAFDYAEFCRRVLHGHWKSFTLEQQQEFIDVFSNFLAKFYLSRLQEKYNHQQVEFKGQDLLPNLRAAVHVTVWWRAMLVPVEVLMLKRDGTWKAYDVVVFGVSAVHNYRAQFQELLLTQSPSQVIELVKHRTRQEQERFHHEIETEIKRRQANNRLG